ncbi:MAG: hypothetical protein AB7I48_04720 [Planctomycetaceae bacterium]
MWRNSLITVRVLGVVLLGSVAATAALLWGTSIPLGVPGEWTWPRLPGTVETLGGGAGALAAGVLYISFVLWRRRGIVSRSRRAMLGWLSALVAASFAWLWIVQQSVPEPADLGKVPYILFYPRSSGYFWQARYEVANTADFLAHYEELLAERDYLHIGTHPPGLTLSYRGVLALCESSPGLCDAILWTCPESARESLRSIRELSAQSGRIVTPADQAAIWFAALITLSASAATVVGIYVLVHRHFDRAAAWTAAGLWPLVPAIAVFHPKSDTLFPFVAVTAAALWMRACDRRSLGRAFLAGCVLWVGMMLSLAFATIGLVITAMTVWEWSIQRSSAGLPEEQRPGEPFAARGKALLLAAGAAGFIVPTVGLGVLGEINLLNVWRWNLANHALFYEHNARTAWKWLAVNPLELAMAVGLPTAWAAGASLWQMMRSRTLVSGSAGTAAGFAVVWALLWLLGKNMGEAARLWILLMPWVVMSAAPLLRCECARGPSPSPRVQASGPWRVTPAALILTAQMIVCILTVLRIDGFHFTELVESLAPATAR